MPVMMFDTFEEMFEQLKASRAVADVRITPQQRAVKPGDFVLRIATFGDLPLVIYGEILDVIEVERPYYDLTTRSGRREFRGVEERYKVDGPWHQSFRFGRFYSSLCPEGEYGDIHLATITSIISSEEFNQAQATGWPQPDRAGRARG